MFTYRHLLGKSWLYTCKNTWNTLCFFICIIWILINKGQSVSEALILESVNPQYDDRLFIDLQLLTQKKNMLCTKNAKKMYTPCSELVFFWVRSRKSMNNLLSYCGLTHARSITPLKNIYLYKMPSVMMKLVLR